MNVVTVLRKTFGGTVYDVRWVERLFAAVRRRLPCPRRFYLLSDVVGPKGVTTIPLVSDLPGWWAKIELFRPGLFPVGETVLYLDLDTVIPGDLSPLRSFQADFATLSDFYDPKTAASGVMMWRAGKEPPMFDLVDAFPPECYATRFDHWWNPLFKGEEVARLQDLFPGFFGSYKADDLALAPGGFSVVSFHGEPRLYNVRGWARDEWLRGES